MIEYKIQDTTLIAIADEVRRLASVGKNLSPAEMAELLKDCGKSGPFAYSVIHDESYEFMSVDDTSAPPQSFLYASLTPPYTSACYQPPSPNTATTLTGTIEAKAGDWVLATVTTRSATTLPSDWTLLHEGTPLNDDSNGLSQRMSLLCKYVEEDSTVSFTVNQTSDARIYLNLLVFSGIGGFKYHEGSEFISNTQLATYTVPRPNCDVVVWACSAVTWVAGSSQWCCDYDRYTVTDIGPANDARQANIYDPESAEERTFSNTTNTATYVIIDCVEVLSA